MTTLTTTLAVVNLRERHPQRDAFPKSSSARAISITLARIPVATLGVFAIFERRPLLAAASFVVFAIVDVFDGMIARLDHSDNASRRALDVVIDRVAIHSATLSCVLVYRSELGLAVLFILRDVAQGIYGFNLAVKHRIVFIGPKWHMAYGLTFLCWGLEFIANGSPSLSLTIALAVVSALTMGDYLKRTWTFTIGDTRRSANDRLMGEGSRNEG